MIKHFNQIYYHSLKRYESYLITVQTLSTICHVLQAHDDTLRFDILTFFLMFTSRFEQLF